MVQNSRCVTSVQRVFTAAALSMWVLSGAATAQAGDNREATTATADASTSWQSGLNRTDLIAHDLGGLNLEVIQARVDFDPGVAAPKHSHPGVEIAHVLKGNIEYTVEGQPPRVLTTGDSLYIPPGVPHIAKNVGTDVGSELATYIVEKGKPLVKLEK